MTAIFSDVDLAVWCNEDPLLLVGLLIFLGLTTLTFRILEAQLLLSSCALLMYDARGNSSSELFRSAF